MQAAFQKKIANKTAPKKNRVVEELRMRSPIDARLPEMMLS
jgi:hypothetical protein